MSGLTMLALAAGSFVGTHLLLSHPLRAPLAGRLGEQAFLGVYSLVAAVTLGWMIYVAVTMPALPPLWIAPRWFWDVASLIMLIAAVLLVGANIGNPASVDPSGKPRFPDRPRGVLAITRHPLMWSIMLWALVHVLLWGSPATLVICAAMALLALVGALGQDAKKARLIGQPWRDWQAKTSFIPFAAIVTGKLPWASAVPGPVPLLGGLFVWLLATWLHGVSGGPTAGPWLWVG